MHRFFVSPEVLSPFRANIMLPEKLAHQVRDVLHLSVGEQLVLLDNGGDEFFCTVTKTGRVGVEGELVERRAGKQESPVRLVLCQGLLKSARFEWILEKGTELGVSVFVPTLCRRSMSGLEDAGPAKVQRWQRILQEATEQCGRSRIPELQPIRPLLHTLKDIPQGAVALMPWEEEHSQSLRDVLQNKRPIGEIMTSKSLTVVVFIGPEGGLMVEEVMLAQRHGVQAVTLGPRILRAETAALAAVANIMYALE